jgi:outer membrane protein OmpA-like peptidoglycan-associated protein
MNRRVEIYLQPLKAGKQTTDSGKFSIFKTLSLDNIYFRPDEPVIESSSMPYLDHVAEILKTYKTEHFEIRGHVNWTPTNTNADSGYKKKMDQLSTDRAKVVYDILIDKGIAPQRMVYKGMGNTEMIYPYAATDEEKRKNMRVEILILRKSD